MARIKYYNQETKKWEYADNSIGNKPVVGVDYFTDEDKAEIVQSVLASLPVYDGGVN